MCSAYFINGYIDLGNIFIFKNLSELLTGINFKLTAGRKERNILFNDTLNTFLW